MSGCGGQLRTCRMFDRCWRDSSSVFGVKRSWNVSGRRPLPSPSLRVDHAAEARLLTCQRMSRHRSNGVERLRDDLGEALGEQLFPPVAVGAAYGRLGLYPRPNSAEAVRPDMGDEAGPAAHRRRWEVSARADVNLRQTRQ
jgi:hypothetical protein